MAFLAIFATVKTPILDWWAQNVFTFVFIRGFFPLTRWSRFATPLVSQFNSLKHKISGYCMIYIILTKSFAVIIHNKKVFQHQPLQDICCSTFVSGWYLFFSGDTLILFDNRSGWTFVLGPAAHVKTTPRTIGETRAQGFSIFDIFRKTWNKVFLTFKFIFV